jgi:hypothetical protein
MPNVHTDTAQTGHRRIASKPAECACGVGRCGDDTH